MACCLYFSNAAVDRDCDKHESGWIDSQESVATKATERFLQRDAIVPPCVSTAQSSNGVRPRSLK